MAQMNERIKALPAAAALVAISPNVYLRVKYDGSFNLIVATASDYAIGTLERNVFTAFDSAPVLLDSAQGTRRMVAAGPITKGVTVYAAAAGKIDATGTIIVGQALEAATADGDIIEVNPRTPSGTLVTLTGSETLTNKTLTAPILNSAIVSSGTLAAAGSTNANGGSIIKDLVTITASDATKGVVLPTGVAGMRVTVINTVAAVLKVYPAGSGTINGVAAATGVAVTASAVATFYCTAADVWYGTTAAVLSSN